MNCKALIPALALLSLSIPAQAADLWNLLGSGDTALPGGDVVYALKGSGNVTVNVALTFGPTKGDGYTALTLRAFKFTGSLTLAELTLFASNVAQEASFSYTAGIRTAQQAFGPLRMELEKRSSARGHTVSVLLSRDGTGYPDRPHGSRAASLRVERHAPDHHAPGPAGPASGYASCG